MICAVVLAILILSSASLNVPQKSSEESPTPYFPEDTHGSRGNGQDIVGLNSRDVGRKQILVIRRKRDVPSSGLEMDTAQSRNNYVYRPLFVYRKIEHSKRRITMYNSFVG